MKSSKLWLKGVSLLTLAIFLGFSLSQPGLAQNETEKYFPETHHWVTGVFLEYFLKRGGLEIFGYPISEPFMDQGLLVQYFQKVRMEWHPQNPDPYKVQLGLLGEELKYRQSGIPAPYPQSRRKIYFPETEHTLAYAFLDYFRTHGGLDIFGYPITEMHFEEGKIVQYFQRAKMEWRPEDPAATIRIGDLGTMYVNLYRDRMPTEAFQPMTAEGDKPGLEPTSTPTITAVSAVVSLKYWVLGQNRVQTVSVLVTDNFGTPVNGAQVNLQLETPDGEKLPGNSQPLITNERGFAQTELPVNWERSGTQIIVKANVTYNGLSTMGQNIFLLWF
ncbi:MAG TPA: Ig-like domain-containing protein [Anaerolineae bacterium]|nr:Ig-like domain-containing protein [Anaerolineae bacterium]